MEPSVLYRADGGVAVVTLNRPAARNAVNPALAAELEEAVDRIEADDAIRAAGPDRRDRWADDARLLRRRRPQGRRRR